ncbi:hypothetical protein AMTRI_Chr03g50870 [Amborella trichopoda]
MLACIACSKHLDDGEEEENARGTPRNKDGVKSITAQIKDMALKFSSAYRQCKPCTSSSSSYRKGRHPFLDIDAASEEPSSYAYHRPGSSSSTPAWDFPSQGSDPHALVDSSRFKRPLSLEGSSGLGVGSGRVVLEEEEEPKEWQAQVEPGVLITFVSLPGGGNDLKRIRFSRELFDKWQAQRWWGENYDRIMELYNVERFTRQAVNLPTPPRSEDERDASSRVNSARESPVTPPLAKERTHRNFYRPTGKGYFSDSAEKWASAGSSYGGYNSHIFNSNSNNNNNNRGETSSIDASRTTSSSRDEASVSYSNASEAETEWVEQDEPGVYITIRALADGTRELRRVRFSRERFGEAHAKLWWEENRERIQAQYL